MYFKYNIRNRFLVEVSLLIICLPFSATRDPSNLLAHEAAFALGQMQDSEALPVLEGILKDFSLHPIVRHEVAYPFSTAGFFSIFLMTMILFIGS